MRGVRVSLSNGNLGGTLQTADGICGMVLTGVSEMGGYTLGDVLLVTSLANMVSLGITLVGNPFAYRQVKDYYTQAGDGAQLYLMLVPTTMRVYSMCDIENPFGAVALLRSANGKVKVLGVMGDDVAIDADDGVSVDNGLNEDVAGAIVNMQVMADAFADDEQPFRAIIGGTSYSGTAADLVDQTENDKNRVAVLIGDTVSLGTNCSACLGLCLGTVASLKVDRKISRVRNGSLPTTTAFLADQDAATAADITVIADRGYITFVVYKNKAGFFFSGDPMCTAPTDDYNCLARGRVIDKAHRLSYLTYVEEVGDSVPTIAGGLPEPGWAKWLEQQVINQVNLTMIANGECSGVKCQVPLDQNITSTGTVKIKPRIQPVAYADFIDIDLGFSL